MNPHVSLAHYTYAFPAVPPIIVGCCMAVLTVVVVFRERSSRVSLAFGALAFSTALWLMSFGGIYGARDLDTALWWAKIEHIGVVFIPSTLFYFTLQILRRADRFRLLARVSLSASVIFLAGLFFTRSFIP